MKLLEELWHGQLCPIADDSYRTAEYQELLRLYERQQASLLAALNDQQKDILQNMQQLDAQMQGLTARAAFINGYCLATQLLSTALHGPYKTGSG